MVKFPLTRASYEKEREKIVTIGLKNGYKKSAIENIIKKHERREQMLQYSTFYDHPRPPNDEVTRISMVYCPEITKVLKPIYQKMNIELVHRNCNSVRQLLGSLKDPIPEVHKSGIYKVTCQEGCPFIYIGRSVRRILVRFGNHMDGWINNEPSESAIASHLINENHETDGENLSLVRQYNDARKIDAMEAVYINKYKHYQLMNKNHGKTSPLLTLVDPIIHRNSQPGK